MLQQIDVLIEKPKENFLYSDLSVKLHGYIMKQIPTEYAEQLHQQQVNPFSIYTVDAGDVYISRISALDLKARQILSVLKKGKKIQIYGIEKPLEILDVFQQDEISIEKLAKLLNPYNIFKITFLTPAMFKSKGKRQWVPEFSSYFNSVIQKLEMFEQISITKEELLEAFSSMRVLEYQLKSESFNAGNHVSKTTGMVGSLLVKLPQHNSSAQDSMRILLAYATFSGVGQLTTQGMGGFLVERGR